MDVHFPGPPQGSGQGLELAGLALEPRVEPRLHQVQHRPHPAGRHPHLVHPFRIPLPVGVRQAAHKGFHPPLQGPVQQNGKLQTVHRTILGPSRLRAVRVQ